MNRIAAGGAYCALCREAIRPDDDAFVTPDFIADETDPLWRFADAPVHRACFLVWDRRKTFVARYNRVARDSLARDGAYPRLSSEGVLEGSNASDHAGIADLYDAYVTDIRDHAFWSQWAGRATGPILELMAGTGRVTEALRAASEQPLVALDLSPAMLRRLVRRFRGRSAGLWVVAGDLAALPLAPDRFHLIVIPVNSLGEVVDPAARAAVMRELRRVLAPGGWAVLTFHDPARRRRTLDGTPRRLGPFETGGRRLEVLVRGRLLTQDLAESEQIYRVLDRSGELVEERRLTLRFVLPDATAVVRLAREADLLVDTIHGDYDESAYTPDVSPFIIAVLRR